MHNKVARRKSISAHNNMHLYGHRDEPVIYKCTGSILYAVVVLSILSNITLFLH